MKWLPHTLTSAQVPGIPSISFVHYTFSHELSILAVAPHFTSQLMIDFQAIGTFQEILEPCLTDATNTNADSWQWRWRSIKHVHDRGRSTWDDGARAKLCFVRPQLFNLAGHSCAIPHASAGTTAVSDLKYLLRRSATCRRPAQLTDRVIHTWQTALSDVIQMPSSECECQVHTW